MSDSCQHSNYSYLLTQCELNIPNINEPKLKYVNAYCEKLNKYLNNKYIIENKVRLYVMFLLVSNLRAYSILKL